MKQLILLALFCSCAFKATTQNQFRNFREAKEVRYSSTQPVINYTLKVDTNDLSSFWVEMSIRNINDTFQLAMVTHPEYDDRYWNYVRDFTVIGKDGNGKIVRKESALWQLTTSGREAIVKYRIQFPPSGSFRGAWRPFLNSRGILFGGPHSFMYVVGHTLVPSQINLQLPLNWKITTGLIPTSDPNRFFASTVFALVDAPILAGDLKTWKFTVDGTPHIVAYFPNQNSVPFDEDKFVLNIKRFVEQASALFGRLPYREYYFQIQDGAYGGLEHNNSVTIGAQSTQLAKEMTSFMEELGHEYFHSWNLMRIHPIEYVDVSYKKSELSKGLWFSEGLTLFYADLLLRRAGLPVEDSSRVKHFERLIRRYFSGAANHKISPEKVSLASYGPADMLGDYLGSPHLQGEILGAIFDLIIRDATNNRKSMDDVMRIMLERFSGERGFTGKDIENILKEVSGKDFHQFFEDHVRGNKEIDFNKYLALVGMKMDLSWADLMNEEGKLIPDFRAYAYQKEGESAIRFGTSDPESAWAKAGLHTGDEIRSVNDSLIKTTDDFWHTIRNAKLGDKVVIEAIKNTKVMKIPVTIVGYKGAVVHISELNSISERQRTVKQAWLELK